MGLVLMSTAMVLTACAPGTWSDAGKQIDTDVNITVKDNTAEVKVYITPDFLVEVEGIDQTSEGKSNQSINPTLSGSLK